MMMQFQPCIFKVLKIIEISRTSLLSSILIQADKFCFQGRGRGRQNSSNSLNGGGTSTEISGMAVAGGMQTGQGQFEQQQMYASTSGTAR